MLVVRRTKGQKQKTPTLIVNNWPPTLLPYPLLSPSCETGLDFIGELLAQKGPFVGIPMSTRKVQRGSGGIPPCILGVQGRALGNFVKKKKTRNLMQKKPVDFLSDVLDFPSHPKLLHVSGEGVFPPSLFPLFLFPQFQLNITISFSPLLKML